MDVTEFATKAINDKNFLREVFTYVPDEMMKDEDQIDESEKGQGHIGKLFGKYCWPGAQAMGCTFSEEELIAECDRQVEALKGFKKAKLVVRMIKTLAKTHPDNK